MSTYYRPAPRQDERHVSIHRTRSNHNRFAYGQENQ